MRTFLAFEVCSSVYQNIAKMTQHLKSIDSGVRWVKPENTHVTIHFFGEVDEVNIDGLESIRHCMYSK